jgi:hypothetical protein
MNSPWFQPGVKENEEKPSAGKHRSIQIPFFGRNCDFQEYLSINVLVNYLYFNCIDVLAFLRFTLIFTIGILQLKKIVNKLLILV